MEAEIAPDIRSPLAKCPCLERIQRASKQEAQRKKELVIERSIAKSGERVAHRGQTAPETGYVPGFPGISDNGRFALDPAIPAHPALSLELLADAA
jgi:hypothetical protein